MRYSDLWNFNIVLTFLEDWPDKYLSHKQLSAKLTMLLCLISCKRVSDLRVFCPEGDFFAITSCRSVSYPAFPGNSKLCVVRCLKAYEVSTIGFRCGMGGQLLIALQKPFRPVAAATISRWMR